jgi:hypothetical protein
MGILSSKMVLKYCINHHYYQNYSTYEYYCYCKNYYRESENKIVESILRKLV